jgi:thioredoxin-related protein
MAMMRSIAAALFAALVAGTISISAYASDKPLLPAIEPDEGGMYQQPWFHESFLDLAEDVAEAKAEGKQVVIMWEQRGCPYCREMHNVNLRVPEIVDYIKANFTVIQLNLWGDREVTDFDGEVTTEKKLARKYRVQFTPTLQFFPDTAADTKQSGNDAEVWRLMGYWKPFHFLNSFRYVKNKDYIEQPNFQRWLQALAEKMEAEGKEVKIW